MGYRTVFFKIDLFVFFFFYVCQDRGPWEILPEGHRSILCPSLQRQHRAQTHQEQGLSHCLCLYLKDCSYLGLTTNSAHFVHQVLEISDHLPVQVTLKNAAQLLQATPLITLISICVIICSFLPALWLFGWVFRCQCQ